MRTFALLGLALLLAPSCSPISVEQHDYTISRHVTRVQNQRAPEQDRLEVRSHLEGNIAVVEVAGNLACLVRDSETRVERHDTIRRANPSVVVLETVGLGVGGMGFYVTALAISISSNMHDDEYGTSNAQKEKDASKAQTLAIIGLGMAIAAAAVGVTEAVKAKDSSEERNTTRVSPTYLGACAGSGAQGRLVSLVAPGANLAAVADAQGVARIPIDDATWERNGGVFDAEVRLDGVPVGRIRLVRPAH